jgi:hypothetical protein
MRVLFFFQLLLVSFACAQQNYIVVFKPGTPMALIELLLQTVDLLLSPLQRFSAGTFNGFATSLSPQQAQILSKDPNVSLHFRIKIYRVEDCNSRMGIEFADFNRSNTLKRMDNSMCSVHHHYTSLRSGL